MEWKGSFQNDNEENLPKSFSIRTIMPGYNLIWFYQKQAKENIVIKSYAEV